MKAFVKKHVKLLIVIAIVIVALAVIVIVRKAKGSTEMIARSGVTTLTSGDFMKTVAATGVVECRDPHYIYSNQSLPVQEVLVELGDKVTPETVLCKLDTQTLQDQIDTQIANMSIAERKAHQDLVAANRTLDNQVNGINTGTDKELITAASNVIAAKEKWEKAEKTYDDYMVTKNSGQDTNIVNADNSVRSAQASLEQAEGQYNDAKESKTATEQQIKDFERAVNTARVNLDNANASRQAVLRQYDVQLANYAEEIDNAFQDYMTAILTQYATGQTVYQSALASSDKVASAKLEADTSVNDLKLAQLERDLRDAEIKAGYSGTVTSIGVKQGDKSGSGIMFTVEDTGDLVVKTDLKEFDVNDVKEGMKVIITAATSDASVYDGKIENVAPAAKKVTTATNSSSDTKTDAVYEVKTSVTSPDENLKIGMQVKLKIVTDEEKGVFSVPFDSVSTDENGESSVLMLTPAGVGNDTYRIDKVTVRTGEENDLNVVVAGSGLKEGALLLNNVKSYEDKIGKTVVLTDLGG